jgi:hypothetical protein
MKSSYQIVDVKDSRGYAKYLAQNGQLLLPLVELLEASRLAVDELIDILGYRDLWMLKVKLDNEVALDSKQMAA